MGYEPWKVVGEGGIELVQCYMEGSTITLRAGPASGFMTARPEGSEEPITMPREHAEALAFIVKNSQHEAFRRAKAVRA